LYYDAAHVISRATSLLLQLGKDFEETEKLRDAMIETRFTGCSGPISFSKDSNNRDMATFDINNYQIVDDKYTSVPVGIYSPLGLTQFSYYGDGILFADGTNVPPKESRATDYYCPFDESEAETFDNGIMLIYVIAFVHLVCTG
jgi:hypothetical protein